MKKLKFIVVFTLFALAVVLTSAVVSKDSGAGAAAVGESAIEVSTTKPVGKVATPPPPLRDELAFRAFQELVNQFDR